MYKLFAYCYISVKFLTKSFAGEWEEFWVIFTVRKKYCMNRSIILIFCILLPFGMSAQVWPKEGSKLNYRIIGFSVPEERGVKKYKIEIAAGKFFSADSFKRKITVTAEKSEPKIIAEVPEFGREYTWRVVYSGRDVKEGALHHFSTGTTSNIDTSKRRLRIMHQAEQFKDYYVAIDRGGVMYDMQGKAVWFVPDPEGAEVNNVGDMKFTKDGTVTFIYGYCVEMDYNGKILWKTPKLPVVNKDTSRIKGEIYHHELTKLPNGHYMVLALETFLCKKVTVGDSVYIATIKDETVERDGYKLGKFGCLLEYDERGNIVWMWKSSDYLLKADFAYWEPDNSMLFDAHDNAFFFDEKNNVIYIGYKNMHRIIKIDRATSKVLSTYGKIYKPGAKDMGRGMFCMQHSIGITEDGYMLLFNNNACNQETTPSVQLFKEPASSSDTLKKVWEYVCDGDGVSVRFYNQGGNAISLPDKCIFINMGSRYSKLQILNRDKKVLWSALPERYQEVEEKWQSNYQYRVNIINRSELERLIWAAQEKP